MDVKKGWVGGNETRRQPSKGQSAAAYFLRCPQINTRRRRSTFSAESVNQDLRDVFEKNVLTNGRSAVLPHCGHAAFIVSCSVMERVMFTSRRQFSQ
jgi:hypothetical protein